MRCEDEVVGGEEGDFALLCRGRVCVDSEHVCRAGYCDQIVDDNLELSWKRAGGRLSLDVGNCREHTRERK